MFKNITFKLALLVVVLASSACDKWLYLEPEDGIVRQEFWKTKEQVESALIGCYASMLEDGFTERLFLWGELRADMLTPNIGIRADELFITYNTIFETNTVSDWRNFYRTINYCNTVIHFAPEAVAKDKTFSEVQLNAYLAEAYSIRALLYFYLVRTFGEVPLKLDATIGDDQDIALPKNSEREILDQILNDLKWAETYAKISFGNVSHNKGRFTRYGINALQADIYLWREQYDSCIIACNKIINSGQFGLIEGNSSWFNTLYGKGNSNESILELQFDNQKLNPFFSMFSTTVGRRFLASPSVLEDLYKIDYENPENKDIRADGASVKSSDGTVWKYIAIDNNTRRSSDESFANWIFYRYADILLMKAEALAQTGGGEEALELIELIRDRAQALELTAKGDIEGIDIEAINEYLLEERARELAFEGKRWFDVLRFAKRNNYARLDILINIATLSAPASMQQSIINKLKDKNSHYLPIYYYELATNKNLVQNPFYVQ